MKKIIFIIAIFCISSAKAQQKVPDYSGHAFAGITAGKNYSGLNEKNLQLKVEGVYGWFFYQFKRFQPFKSQSNPGLDKLTMASMGYGKNTNISENIDFAWGLGANMSVTPDTGFTKKNLIFWGGTLYGNVISEESGFEAEASLNYCFMPKNHEYDWAKSLFTPEVKVKKFFGGKKFKAGVGFEYRLRMYTQNEPQQQTQNYYGISISDSKSEIAGLICVNFKNFGVELGPVFTRTKFQYKDKTGLNLYDAQGSPTMWRFGLLYNFSYKNDR